MMASAMLRRALLVTGTNLLLAAPVSAQRLPGDGPDLVDRVLAVVGDSTVLLSQVLEEIEQLKVQKVDIPTDPLGVERMYRQIVDQFVNQLLVLQAAAKDTLVKVDEDHVTELVDQELQQRAQSLGGQAQLTAALARSGMTMGSYREMLTTQIRHSQIQQMYIQRHLATTSPVEVTEDEIQAAFARTQGSLEQRPKLLTFRQIVLTPSPSDSAKAAARARAEDLLRQIRDGASFEDLARRYSDDPGSAREGGELGWFRRGQMVRTFEDAAFSLADGEVSDVVQSEFGFHIIKIERSRSGERKGRHILIAPDVTDADTQGARDLAAKLATQVRDGADIEALSEEYSDPSAPDSMTVPVDQLGQLPPSYAVLARATDGQVVGPLEYPGPRGTTRIAVIKVLEVREAGTYTLEDVRDRLVQQLQQQKRVQRIIDDLRASTYIEIRM